MKKATLLYFHPGYSSFIDKDIRILSKSYNIRLFHFKLSPKKRTPYSFIEQTWFLLKNLHKAKLIVCQFAGYHTLMPVILGKITGVKTLIITGGTESVSFPSIHYGNFHKKVLGFFTKWSLKLCAHISPVHESLVYCEYHYQTSDFPAQGIHYHIKNIATPVTVIYNGYESSLWKVVGEVTRNKKSFITVAGGIDNPMRYILKGIDLIMGLASMFPDCTFTIIGFKNSNTNIVVPANVKLLDYIENTKLPLLFSEHTYYLQLSISEGFPNALCEAMLCGCVPIGSAVGAIPDIIADTGFVLKRKDVVQLQTQITQALQADTNKLGIAARLRIENEFPLVRREKELLHLIEKMMKG